MFYTLPTYSHNTITIKEEEIVINLNLIKTLAKTNNFLVITFSDATLLYSAVENYTALFNKLKEIT